MHYKKQQPVLLYIHLILIYIVNFCIYWNLFLDIIFCIIMTGKPKSVILTPDLQRPEHSTRCHCSSTIYLSDNFLAQTPYFKTAGGGGH